jgi:molybdenum cofactor cytidylyltransferase
MIVKRNLHGLLLAAGRGLRMAGNKQFYPVQTSDGVKPLVAAAFDTIAEACDQMFVVLGHRAAEVAATLGDRQFEIVTVDPDAPMFNSIQSGLRVALTPSRTATRSGKSPAILMQLGDHPAVAPATLEQIFAHAIENPSKAVMPTFQGNGGHPLLIPSAIAEIILATPCPEGLRQFWLEHVELCVRFDVNDPGVTHDIDSL